VSSEPATTVKPPRKVRRFHDPSLMTHSPFAVFTLQLSIIF
jgi:hypothetical protein